MYKATRYPVQRKHTLAFLHQASSQSSIYLQTEIDMSNVLMEREENKNNSYLAYLIFAVTKVIKKYPRANSYVKSGLFPKIISYDTVCAKFLLDKMLGCERIVVSGVVRNADTLNVQQIQAKINPYKESNVEQSDLYDGIKILHDLPLWIGKRLMAFTNKMPKLAINIQGTFSISSLATGAITAFLPITTTTLGFGVGECKLKPVCLGNDIKARPMLPLTMAFDHRVIDGAVASEILNEIKSTIEKFNTGGADV